MKQSKTSSAASSSRASIARRPQPRFVLTSLQQPLRACMCVCVGLYWFGLGVWAEQRKQLCTRSLPLASQYPHNHLLMNRRPHEAWSSETQQQGQQQQKQQQQKQQQQQQSGGGDDEHSTTSAKTPPEKAAQHKKKPSVFERLANPKVCDCRLFTKGSGPVGEVLFECCLKKCAWLADTGCAHWFANWVVA